MAYSFKPCSESGCNGNSHYTAKGARGWCRRHYRLFQAHGAPVPRKAANGEHAAFIQSTVLPYDGDDCLIWPYARISTGYGWAANPNGTTLVHRLACEHRHGPPPSPIYEAAHSCGKGHLGCVAPTHIRWALPAENQAERVPHGTSNRGERCANAKLTADEVREIRRSPAVLGSELAVLYGVSEPAISAIRHENSWAWLDA